VLELWDDSQQLVDAVHALLVKHKHQAHTVWGCPFSPKIQSMLRAKDPAIPCIATVPQLLGLSVAGLFGLLPFMRVEPWLVFNTSCYTAQD
jgi:hypothetical protein